MIQTMQRIQPILQSTLFQETMQRMEQLERERIYCGHDLSHLLDVARIAALLAVDVQAAYPRDVIYAAALLHDIGRVQQYTDGTPHAQAGAAIAQQILQHTEFSQQEQREILQAVSGHQEDTAQNSLTQLIHEADHRCRMCFACAAQDTCKWTVERRNHTIWL